jgi:hypothetical protein
LLLQGFLRLHDAEARAGDQVGPGQAAEARQGHCAHARFPQHPTAKALPELLNQLKPADYKIVHMKAKEPVKTIAQYDELLAKEVKLPTVSDRPTSSVVRAISD